MRDRSDPISVDPAIIAMSQMPVAVGVDIGGTKIAAGLVAADGTVRESCRVPTPARQGRTAILAAIAGAVATVTRGPIAGVGVATGGIVDHEQGLVVAATDLLDNWAGVALTSSLSERLGLPVVADNDGNAFALAETRFGAARDCRDAVCVAVGTGIGGGLVLDGRLRRGRRHLAGEFGHLPAPTDLRCSCGLTGHVEAVAAGPGMLARYRASGGTAADLRGVLVAAEQGDRLAATVLADGGACLGRALAGVVTAVDAEIVVIGGGVAAVGDRYLVPLAEAMYALLPHGVRPPVRATVLGAESAVVGAASLAFDANAESGR